MDLELKPLVCKCCGAPIDRNTMKCDFCGTQYERKNGDMPITFTVERPGVHRIRAQAMVSNEMIKCSPERATEYVMHKLRQGIADGLLEYMKVTTETNPMSMCEIIRGEVRVVDPRFTDSY